MPGLYHPGKPHLVVVAPLCWIMFSHRPLGIYHHGLLFLISQRLRGLPVLIICLSPHSHNVQLTLY